MNAKVLKATAKLMVADGKGLIAMDESTGTRINALLSEEFYRLRRAGGTIGS